MSRQPVQIFIAKTRLAELVARHGGLSRDDAIARAQKSVEGMREQGDAAIIRAIVAIEGILQAAEGKALNETQMQGTLKHADQIVTLAGTFGYAALDRAARSLCDLIDGLIRSNRRDTAPIAVHVQAMHLMTPGQDLLSAAETDTMLGELAKVLAHYGFGTLALPGVAEDAEIALAS